MDPVIAGLLLVEAVAIGYLLWRFLRKRKHRTDLDGFGGDSGFGDGFNGSGILDSEVRAAQRAEQARRAAERAEREAAAKDALVRSVLSGDPDIARQLLRRADEISLTPGQALLDPQAIRGISQRLNAQTLQILSLANRPVQNLKLDLETTEETRPVDYPTRVIEPRALEDLQGLAGVLPEEQMLDDDLFYMSAVTGGLHIPQAFEKDIHRKRLYLLLDISPSMDERMAEGFDRRTWALGLSIKLLVDAMKGDAEYLYRPFDTGPGALYRIDKPEQAQELMDRLSKGGDKGSGTNIAAALKRAVDDIRSSTLEIDTSDILLITDGEDGGLTVEWLKELLGDDIRLHAALLGKESDVLRTVSTDYMVYS